MLYTCGLDRFKGGPSAVQVVLNEGRHGSRVLGVHAYLVWYRVSTQETQFRFVDFDTKPCLSGGC